MFKITLTPIFNPGADALTVTTVGNIITVNGIEYDFTLLDEGDTTCPLQPYQSVGERSRGLQVN